MVSWTASHDTTLEFISGSFTIPREVQIRPGHWTWLSDWLQTKFHWTKADSLVWASVSSRILPTPSTHSLSVCNSNCPRQLSNLNYPTYLSQHQCNDDRRRDPWRRYRQWTMWENAQHNPHNENHKKHNNENDHGKQLNAPTHTNHRRHKQHEQHEQHQQWHDLDITHHTLCNLNKQQALNKRMAQSRNGVDAHTVQHRGQGSTPRCNLLTFLLLLSADTLMQCP